MTVTAALKGEPQVVLTMPLEVAESLYSLLNYNVIGSPTESYRGDMTEIWTALFELKELRDVGQRFNGFARGISR